MKKKSFADLVREMDALQERKAAAKMPEWADTEGLEFPGALCLEQCSSSTAAIFKASLIPRGARVADLTGGLGVDSWAFSRIAQEVLHIERDPELSAAAGRNFARLGAANIRTICAEVLAEDRSLWEEELRAFRPDWIYLDPARRDACGRKVFMLEDCSPDVLTLLPTLREISGNILIKLSPMADISMLTNKLACSEIHVVGLGGEVKELLCLLSCDSGSNEGGGDGGSGGGDGRSDGDGGSSEGGGRSDGGSGEGSEGAGHGATRIYVHNLNAGHGSGSGEGAACGSGEGSEGAGHGATRIYVHNLNAGHGSGSGKGSGGSGEGAACGSGEGNEGAGTATPDSSDQGHPALSMAAFSFTAAEETEAKAELCRPDELMAGKYLLEPAAPLLKAGAFKLPCSRLGIKKLDTSTHLYYSKRPADSPLFKQFVIREVVPFGNACIKDIARRYPQAEVTARNLPITSDSLRARLGCKGGTGVHIFACTVSGKRQIIITSKA